MGPLSRNLRLLQVDTKTTSIVLSVLCILLSSQVQNVITKSAKWGKSSDYPHSTTHLPEELINSTEVIDAYVDPQVTWNLFSSSEPCRFIRGPGMEEFRLAVHLKSCDFDTNDTIEIIDESNRMSYYWYCSGKTKTRFHHSGEESEETSATYWTDVSSRTSSSRTNAKLMEIEHVKDGLSSFIIVPKLNNGKQSTKQHLIKRKQKLKAAIVVNIYKDIPRTDSCPEEFFNCYQDLCESTCCSESSSESAGWSRCIPKALKCNGNPNCGVTSNRDEANQICQPETYCECNRGICLTWNYVLTSLAIAILFIITPTAIVFALFHRRNVALERARLIRLAQLRMADMRGEFTRDDPFNDFPPTYDEVYDIKEPPPCFCKAIAMQQEYDLRNQNNSSSPASSQLGIQRQNLGFQCSCADICAVTNESDIPPSYIEVSRDTTTNESSEAPPPGEFTNVATISAVVSSLQQNQHTAAAAQDADLYKSDTVWKP